MNTVEKGFPDVSYLPPPGRYGKHGNITILPAISMMELTEEQMAIPLHDEVIVLKSLDEVPMEPQVVK